MSNTILLSQQHSGIVRSLQSSGVNNAYVYSVDSSVPNVSQTIAELRPSSEATGNARQTLEFPLARQGFCNGMILQVNLSAGAEADGDAIAFHMGANMVSSVELTVRGRPIRKASTLALIDMNLKKSQGGDQERYGLAASGGNLANNETRTVYLDVGRVFGITSNPMNNLDSLFCEDMTINIVLEAVASFTDANRDYTSARLFCRYGMLESAEYDKYRSENFSSTQPTRRLVVSHEKEVKKRLTGLTAGNVETAMVDLKMKNLVTKTVVAVEAVFGDAWKKGRFNRITALRAYANGQEIWATSSPEACFLLDVSDGDSDKAIKDINLGEGHFSDNDNKNVYSIEWSQTSLPDKLHDSFKGGLNLADLTSAYLEISFVSNQTSADIHVSHECRLLESVDGNSGLVSVSARE